MCIQGGLGEGDLKWITNDLWECKKRAGAALSVLYCTMDYVVGLKEEGVLWKGTLCMVMCRKRGCPKGAILTPWIMWLV